MSGRSLSSALLALADSTDFPFLLFVKLEFDGGTIYLHNGVGVITWDSQNWQGVGDFGGIEPIKEGVELSPYALVMGLSGLDTSLMDEVMNQDYYLRPVTVYIGAIDRSTGGLVADPDQLWAGEMNMAEVVTGTTNGIRLTSESAMAVFERTNNTRFSDTHLQREYSGDLFFQYAEQIAEQRVIWGGSQAPTGTRDSYPQFEDSEYGEWDYR